MANFPITPADQTTYTDDDGIQYIYNALENYWKKNGSTSKNGMKQAVDTESALPTTDNGDGDMRLVTSTNTIYSWSSTTSQWTAVTGTSGNGAGTTNNYNTNSTLVGGNVVDVVQGVALLRNAFRYAESKNAAASTQNHMYVDVFTDASGVDVARSSVFKSAGGQIIGDAPALDSDVFPGTSLSTAWTQTGGTSSVSSGKVTISSATGVPAIITRTTPGAYTKKITVQVDATFGSGAEAWLALIGSTNPLASNAYPSIRLGLANDLGGGNKVVLQLCPTSTTVTVLYSAAIDFSKTHTLTITYDPTNGNTVAAVDGVQVYSGTQAIISSVVPIFDVWANAAASSHSFANFYVKDPMHTVAAAIVTNPISTSATPTKAIIDAECTGNATFDVSLDDGVTWKSGIVADTLADLSGLNSTNKIRIRSNLSADTALQSLGLIWYDAASLMVFNQPMVSIDVSAAIRDVQTNFRSAEERSAVAYAQRNMYVDVFSDDSGIDVALSSAPPLIDGSLTTSFSLLDETQTDFGIGTLTSTQSTTSGLTLSNRTALKTTTSGTPAATSNSTAGLPIGTTARTIMFRARNVENDWYHPKNFFSYGGAGTGQRIVIYFGNYDSAATAKVITVDVVSAARGFVVPVADSNWHDYAIVIPSGANLAGVQIYQDGVLLSPGGSSVAVTTVINTTATPLNFGTSEEMGDLSIWNTALTQTQIQGYIGTLLQGAETGLTLYYRCNEGTGTTIIDHSTTGNNATLSAAAAWVVDASRFQDAGSRINTITTPTSGTVESSSISWTSTNPTSTAVTMQTSVDGGSTWQTVTSGSPIPNFSTLSSNGIQYKILLSTTKLAVAPTVTSITIEYALAGGNVVTKTITAPAQPTKAIVVPEATGTVTYDLSLDDGATWLSNVAMNALVDLSGVPAGTEIRMRANLAAGSTLQSLGLAWYDANSVVNISAQSANIDVNANIRSLQSTYRAMEYQNTSRQLQKGMMADIFVDAAGIDVANSAGTSVVSGEIAAVSAMPLALTANNIPSPYVASASSIFSSTYVAYKAFDGLITNGSPDNRWVGAGAPSTSSPEWLKIDLGSATILRGYQIFSANGEYPTSWSFQGSNDNANWTTLDTRSGIVWGSTYLTNRYLYMSSTAYRYYRLYITAFNSLNGNSVAIQELQLLQSAPVTVTTTTITAAANPLKVIVNAEYTGTMTFDLSFDDGVTWPLLGVATDALIDTSNVTPGNKLRVRANLDAGAVLQSLGLIWYDNAALMSIIGISTGVPTGTVHYFTGTTAPYGFIKCNGAAVSRTTYSDLFNAIGTTFGAGDGSTTFQLPDLRGQFLRGYDDGAGIDSGRMFGSTQDDLIKNHDHFAATNSYYSYVLDWIGSGGGNVLGSGVNYKTRQMNANGYNTGGGAETRPKNIALLPCIKY